MLPVDPPEMVQGLRHTFNPPPGIDEVDCGKLTVIITEGEGAFEGCPVHVSYWQFSKEELNYLARSEGGYVELQVMSAAHPPIAMNVVNLDGD